MQPFDPNSMDPKAVMALSQLVQQLPPDKLREMQTLMHNMMAGIDVRREMEEFERGLPPQFRERMASIMGTTGMSPFGGTGHEPRTPTMAMVDTAPTSAAGMSLRDARLTLLRAVADGQLPPEDAEKLLFPEG